MGRCPLMRQRRSRRPNGSVEGRSGRIWSGSLASRTAIGVLASVILMPGSIGSAAVPAWNQIPAQSVAGENFILNGVAAPAAGDIWTVGYHWETVGGALEFRTLAEHFNGSRFVVVPTPDRETAPAVDMLDGITGVSPNSLWAVGTSSPPASPEQTLIEHWNGMAWSIVSSPDPGGAGDLLQGVAAVTSADVWAVGARQDAGSLYQRPMAEHWNGKAWSVLPVPNASGCTGHSSLTGVAAVSSVDVWATGWCGSGGTTPDQGFVVHWDGRHWSVVAGKGVLPGHSQLYGVSAGGPDDIWVIGNTQAAGASQPVAWTEHWNGATWARAAVTGMSHTAGLRSVAVSSALSWAVGAGTSPQPPFAGPASADSTGGAWRTVPVTPPFGSLSGVCLDPSGHVWAVGNELAQTGFDRPLIVEHA
jgi:hypothetical protein